MMRILCLVSMLVIGMISAATSFGADPLPPEVENFLGSREVLGIVPFAPGSTVLSPSAQSEIDRLVAKLEKIDKTRHIIRIEGFSSQAGTEPCNEALSMMRAKAVIDYIRQRYELDSDLYLTGYPLQEDGSSAPPANERVEFALYENRWDFDQLNADKTIVR